MLSANSYTHLFALPQTPEPSVRPCDGSPMIRCQPVLSLERRKPVRRREHQACLRRKRAIRARAVACEWHASGTRVAREWHATCRSPPKRENLRGMTGVIPLACYVLVMTLSALLCASRLRSGAGAHLGRAARLPRRANM